MSLEKIKMKNQPRKKDNSITHHQFSRLKQQITLVQIFLLPIDLLIGIVWCAVLIVPCEIIGLLIWLSERRGTTSRDEPNLFPYIPFIILACVYNRLVYFFRKLVLNFTRSSTNG